MQTSGHGSPWLRSLRHDQTLSLGIPQQGESSRRLERECLRNLELIWLLCRLAPDFKTIADFRKDNAKAFKQVFRDFNTAQVASPSFPSADLRTKNISIVKAP